MERWESSIPVEQFSLRRGSRKMTTEKVCLKYQKLQESTAREKLLMEYLPLVKYIAGHMAIGLPRSVEIDDLISAGVVGLIEALNNFDPSRGVKLETFASARIRGAIVDELRRMDWMPRSARKNSRRIKKAVSQLEHQLGRQPTHKELAQNLGISTEELSEHLAQTRAGSPLVSLDRICYSNDDSGVSVLETVSSDQEDTLSRLEKESLKEYLVEQIEKLPEQQRMVLVLHYYEELTLKEISKIMHISESRVSQIHTKTILMLRAKVRKWLKDGW